MADTEGFDELLDFLANAPQEFNKAIDKGLSNTGIMAETDIKAITPVGVYPNQNKTGGTLKRNWTHTEVETTGNDKVIIVGNPIPYAEPVEEGHKTVNGYGFVEGRHMARDVITLYEDRDVLGANIINELNKIK
ncbi:HK97 gp10 family phage protein [uncultured Clostridium sp.]|uniref:HK97 gp10 family phage protein n=1 Tax=uncultured Clostridium sp. TaxID=59620 RepID=UPI0025FFD454|nr:HK97 gp10 family phage protein [uncultured Clostridium sp.]